jgi:hypothetical protein
MLVLIAVLLAALLAVQGLTLYLVYKVASSAGPMLKTISDAVIAGGSHLT